MGLSPADQMLALEIEIDFLTQMMEQIQKDMIELDNLMTTIELTPRRQLEGIRPNMVAERLKLFELKK